MKDLTLIAPASGETQLVPVYRGTIGGVPASVVNARELHTYLENGDHFAGWIKERIEKYEFAENQDFEVFRGLPKNPQGGRPATDYLLSLDMAKELSMVENNAKGREARRYFIAMERRALEANGHTVPVSDQPTNPNLDRPRPRIVKEAFSAGLHIAKLCGFTGNQALLSADCCSKQFTGMSALAVIGATHLIADTRGRTYTPTELGKMMVETKGPRAVNKLFEDRGMQMHDISGEWVPTDAAAGHYEWSDTGKRHTSDGTPVKQLKWFASILDVLGISYTNLDDAA